jgi:F0F1-type ATP synthase alpha subunit
VDQEILIVAAGVSGVLDDIPTPRIREFEAGLYRYYEPHRARLAPLLCDPKTGVAALTEVDRIVAEYKATVHYDQPKRA